MDFVSVAEADYEVLPDRSNAGHVAQHAVGDQEHVVAGPRGGALAQSWADAHPHEAEVGEAWLRHQHDPSTRGSQRDL